MLSLPDPRSRAVSSALSRFSSLSNVVAAMALVTLSGCAGTPNAGEGSFEADSDAAIGSIPASDAGTSPERIQSLDASGPVASIAVAPLALVPPFSPDVQDYYVRCAAGENTIALTVTDGNGISTTSYETVVPDQAIVVGGYWIRCLPPDFPTITTTANAGTGPTSGYYLVNTIGYGMVLDTRGTPVWYARGTDVVNLDSQQANLLSLMPAATSPYGTSLTTDFELHALDTQTTTSVRASGGPTDAHELRFLPNGDFLLFTYPMQTGVDLTGLGFGTNQIMADCEVQEVDPSGNLVWSWLATDHVDPVTESLEPANNDINGVSVIDVFHCNAIDVDASGNLLISMRHANAVFYVDRTTGRVLWKLGGTAINKDGAALVQVTGDSLGTFSMQHDARLQANGNVSMFDDHGATSGVARGVEYSLDHDAGTATVAFEFLGLGQAQYEGSFRLLPDGERVIGWGYVPGDPRVLTEVDPDGNDVFDVSFAPVTTTYRAVKVTLDALDIDLLRATAAKW
jgi:hypothetical protein